MEILTMNHNPIFKNRDYTLSPYTGLTRRHWIQAGKTILEGIFTHLPDPDAPVLVPRKETQVTYPHPNAPENVQATERKAEIFEGLTRSFLIASVLINLEPDLTINGIRLADYYRLHILRSCADPEHEEFAGTYAQMQELTGHADPFRPFQQTVETCALVIGLWACRDHVWLRFSQNERDRIATFLSDYAVANTVPQNWRLFNMLDMAFLKQEGYEIDRSVMREHAQAILAYDTGDGWYRDGHSFDYYSCWAFGFYTPLWNLWYGYENEPYLAQRFEENSRELMRSYPDFFDRDGFTNMWGRSSIYRNVATSALDGHFMLKDPVLDPGLARRICSGSLLQFMDRDDFLWEGVPTLGFYGQFTPLVQPYSCAESVYWLGKAFFCLHLPEDHPFWTSVENGGVWDEMAPGQVHETVLDGPGLAFTNHEASGETILRTGKVLKEKGDLHGMWGYGKLCYNTKFPWEAGIVETEMPSDADAGRAQMGISPNDMHSTTQTGLSPDSPPDNTQMRLSPDSVPGTPRPDLESQQYVLEDLTQGGFQRGNAVFWHGCRDGVLYRRQFFDFTLEKECHWLHAINLADFPVPLGILRADKLRLYKRPMRITLGAYGFPDNGTTVERRSCGNAQAVILHGSDHCGRPVSLAMTIYDGWDELKLVHSRGSNPDSADSILVYAVTDRLRQYDSTEPYVLISQVLTRTDGKTFSEEELFPLKGIEYTDDSGTGAYGPVRLSLKNGRQYVVDYDRIEGHMML